MADDIVYFTTVEQYVKIKIERNKAMVDFLNIKNKILKKEILLNHKNVLVNNDKIALINEINQYESKQAIRFLEDCEELLVEKYNFVNNLTVEDLNERLAEIAKLHDKLISKLNEINNLNDQIPKEIDYVNIGMKLPGPENII